MAHDDGSKVAVWPAAAPQRFRVARPTKSFADRQNWDSMALSEVLAKIIEWLRAGYPQGVPEHDYVPLLALLSRRLTHDEVLQVIDSLIELGALPADRVDVGVAIT